MVRHDRTIFNTDNGTVSTDRDSYCHAFCNERTILALHDVIVDENTGYPMCPMCIKKHDLFLPAGEEDIGEVADEFTDYTITQGDPSGDVDSVQEEDDDSIHRVDIEYQGSKDEMMKMLDEMDLIISRYDFDEEEVRTAIENLQEQNVFLYHYARGFLSTGLMWAPTRELLMQQPAFQEFIEFWEEEDDRIQHGFFGHTTMDGTGHHPVHFDGKLAGSCTRRTITTFGDSDKTMTVQNVENGRWFTFKVPHGMIVTMSELGNGTLGSRYVHSVDACQGTYILAVEQ